jgi:GNAT superfamily N-acetyltransferase
MKKEVEVYYLEIEELNSFELNIEHNENLKLVKLEIPSPELGRFFYLTIGGEYFWVDRLNWDYNRWNNYLSKPYVEMSLIYLNNTPIGYYEINKKEFPSIELVYFGLMKNFISNGYGTCLLKEIIEYCKNLNGNRLWLHTCSLDHEKALNFYKKNGFKLYKTEKIIENIPLKPWNIFTPIKLTDDF